MISSGGEFPESTILKLKKLYLAALSHALHSLSAAVFESGLGFQLRYLHCQFFSTHHLFLAIGT